MHAQEQDPSKPVIVLAAHGERGGARDDERLKTLAEAVNASVPGAEVTWTRVNDEQETEALFRRLDGRDLIVLPLLFSDGFFFEKRLRPHVRGPGQLLLEPLAFWPEFPVFLADNLAARLLGRLADPRVVLVAHGSGKSDASARAAARVAEGMQKRFGQIQPAFLEEEPFAQDAISAIASPYAIVGLFFGAGMHGEDDFSRLISGAPTPPEAHFTVGELPGLTDLVARKALAALAKLQAG